MSAASRLDGVGAGSTSVAAAFGSDSSSDAYVLAVSTAPVDVEEVHLETSFGPQSTFRGELGSTKHLKPRVVWSDGRQFPDAVQGDAASWVAPSLYLSFASDASDAVGVSESGVASLSDNHHEEVELSASASCPDAPPATGAQSVKANLLPANGDVDIGAHYGLQFPAGLAVGDTVDVAVRIRADQALKGFDVALHFDESVVHIATDGDCVIGSGWSDAWGCGVNNVGATDRVTVQGSSATGTSTGTIEVATITFTVVGEGENDFTGSIVEMIRASGTGDPANMVAGAGTVAVGAGRRRRPRSATRATSRGAPTRRT